MTDALKNWVTVILIFSFITLYILAITGWLRPSIDITIIDRLEPLIFVVIGYFFGRMPAQETEHTLKTEISRQSQRADASQHIKEQLQQKIERLEEKIENAKIILSGHRDSAAEKYLNGTALNNLNDRDQMVYSSSYIDTAIKILDS